MKRKSNAWLWLGLLLPMLFSACKKEKYPAPVNRLAAPGTDQIVSVNVPVPLDGSASRDGDGKAFTFAWRFASRPTVSGAILTGAATPAFTPDVAGTYVAELKIASATGHSTDAVTVTAIATAPEEPAAGVINADILQDRHLMDIFTDPDKP